MHDEDDDDDDDDDDDHDHDDADDDDDDDDDDLLPEPALLAELPGEPVHGADIAEVTLQLLPHTHIP